MPGLPDPLPLRLINSARDAIANSYCPYSGFAVGAALLCENGVIVSGCNVENASYSLSLCAERVALVRAVAQGHRHFSALVLFTPTEEPTPPCGACLQALAEFAPKLRILATCRGNMQLEGTLPDFMPHAFSRRNLNE